MKAWKRRRNQRQKCLCGGYHFPHRKGSLFCRHGELGRHGIFFCDRDRPEVNDILWARMAGEQIDIASVTG